MAYSIHVTGIPRFDESILGMREKVDVASREIVIQGSLMIASDAKRAFLTRPSGSQRTSTKTGRTYWSYKPPYQAQPPRPTNRSGALSRSIKRQALTKVPGGWMSLTGPSDGIKYAEYVEYGTSKMRPEPYMETALKKNEIPIQVLAQEEWSKVMI